METSKIEFGIVPANNCKIVSEASIARRLLKDGYHIVDIKPKKTHPRESVFIFDVTPGFMEKLEQYINERREKRVKNEDN